MEGPGVMTEPPKAIPGLTEGRIVHYVLPDGPNAGQHRPAIIVRVWNPVSSTVQLQVFTDGSNDGPKYAAGLFWATSVMLSEEPKPGTWHWIERA